MEKKTTQTYQKMNWKTEKKIKFVSYHQSKFFKKLEKLAYSPLPFRNKRQRVKWRKFFRYYHLRKADRDFTRTLMRTISKNPKPYLAKLSEEINKAIQESFWNIETHWNIKTD